MKEKPKMDEIFHKRDKKVTPVFDVGVMFKRKPKDGDIGIEIEVEGKRLPQDPTEPWVYKVDHSLRGEENAEYVLSKPIKFDDVPKTLEKLWADFNRYKSVIDDSNRTSVHIHLNCQKFHLNRLAAFASLYFCFEDLLTHSCGEHRVGNLFCLRAVDAPAIVSQLKKFFKSDGDGTYQFYDSLHYANFNCHALSQFGSIEIRSMRGTSDANDIIEWVEMLRRLYTLSASFRDPREIIEKFSELGPLAFYSEIMGSMGPLLRSKIPHNDQQVRMAMIEGIRFAQDIAFCRNWDEYQNVDLSPDPFGRDVKQLMNKILNAGTEAPTSAPSLEPFFVEPVLMPEGHFSAPGQFQNEDEDDTPPDLEF